MLDRDCVLPHLHRPPRRARTGRDRDAGRRRPRGHVPRAPRDGAALGRRVPQPRRPRRASTSSRCCRTRSRRSTRGSASRGSARPRCRPTRCTAARCSGTWSTTPTPRSCSSASATSPQLARGVRRRTASGRSKRPNRRRPRSRRPGRGRDRPRCHRSSTARRSSPARSRRPTSSGPDYWDVASIIYTSGTTGPSKGVLVPWGTLLVVRDARRPTTSSRPATGSTRCTRRSTSRARRCSTRRRTSGPAWCCASSSPSRTSGTTCARSASTGAGLVGPMAPFLLMQPEQPDDADTPLRHVDHGPARAPGRGVQAAVRRRGRHRLRHDRDRRAVRVRRLPARQRDELRQAPHRLGRLRGAHRRRARRAARSRARSASWSCAPSEPWVHQPRVLRHAGGDRRGVAQRLVPHRRRLHVRRATATTTSSTASRTRSAAAARTSRRSRSRRSSTAIPTSRSPPASRCPSEYLEDEVKVCVVRQRRPELAARAARRVPRADACRRSWCPATSSSSTRCRRRRRPCGRARSSLRDDVLNERTWDRETGTFWQPVPDPADARGREKGEERHA